VTPALRRLEVTTEVPIACTLDGGDRQARLVSIRELGHRALVGLRVDNRLALLQFRGECERVDALVSAESQCCAFFEFSTSRDGEETEVTIRAPEGGESILRAFVAAIVAGWKGDLV
jgi:hypothetical protein